MVTFRTSWVKCNGRKYQVGDYLLTGWQQDDLPTFGRVIVIFLIKNCTYVKVTKFRTKGIDRHYHSYVLEYDRSEEVKSVDSLGNSQTYNAHLLRNDLLYITMKCHVERFD